MPEGEWSEGTLEDDVAVEGERPCNARRGINGAFADDGDRACEEEGGVDAAAAAAPGKGSRALVDNERPCPNGDPD